MPSSVKTVDEAAFCGNKITEITLHAGVLIKLAAFSENPIKKLTVLDINGQAFVLPELFSFSDSNGKYKFVGWFDNENYSGEIIDKIPEGNDLKSKTFWAKWHKVE